MKRLIQRCSHFIQRIIRGIKRCPKFARNFGIWIAIVSFVDSIFPPEKSPFYIKTIEKYVDKFCAPLLKQYKTLDMDAYRKAKRDEPSRFPRTPIWCCWWQGKDSMPELVKMCHLRLVKQLPDNAELYLLDKSNYLDYVDIPEDIVKCFNDGKITMTEMSDILRVALLSQHGGFWLDATVFMSGEFPNEFLDKPFYAQRMYDPKKWSHEACKGRWCGFIMAGQKDNYLFQYLFEAFCQWWRTYDCVIDYVILDYFMLAAYKEIPEVRDMIDSVPDNNIGIFEMYKVLHQEYSPELYRKLTKDNQLHKLTYKIDLVEYNNGHPTLYRYLLHMVGLR